MRDAELRRPAAAAGGLLRVVACGSVDDGKSTLLGRLFHDLGRLPEDQLETLRRESAASGFETGTLDYSLVFDGLEAERAQGITIDAAYRYFVTERRSFVLIDAPGHVQYTRNMATAASDADAAILVVDAERGVTEQTRRHALILHLFGVRHVALAVNKMDRVGWDRAVFDRVLAEVRAWQAEIGARPAAGFPVAARDGENVCAPAPSAPWWSGPTLLAHLETLDVAGEREARPFRYPVQLILRGSAGERVYAGTVASGTVRPGTRLRLEPAGVEATVARITTADGDLAFARAGDAIGLTLVEDVDVVRGDVLCDARRPARTAERVRAALLWFGSEPMTPGRSYLLRRGPQEVAALPGRVEDVLFSAREEASDGRLQANEAGVCTLTLGRAVPYDPFADDPAGGSIVLIDRVTNETVAAGRIESGERANLFPNQGAVSRAERERLNGHRGLVIWMTGLSGAGKTTVADLVERRLHRLGVRTVRLDGDNLRTGLTKDLGFSDADRAENVRRTGEVARLFVEAGTVTLCSLISPFRSDRAAVRALFAPEDFLEVFVDAPPALCAERDPKGLYARARTGEVKAFTGVSSGYEPPEAPELRLDTAAQDAEACAEALVQAVLARLDAAGQ